MTNLAGEGSEPQSSEGQPREELSNEEKYLHYGMELRSSIEASFEPWLRATLGQRRSDGASPVDAFPDAVESAIAGAREQAIANITRLIEADVSEPLSGPLEQLRQAVSDLALVLDAHDFTRPNRDPYDQEMRPADVYNLGPLSFMDLGEDVQAAGITWGAAKAHLHLHGRA